MELLVALLFIAGVIIAIGKNSSIEDKGCHPIGNKDKDVILKKNPSWRYKGFNGKARSRRKCYTSLKRALGIYKH
jgi:hypothetical protein